MTEPGTGEDRGRQAGKAKPVGAFATVIFAAYLILAAIAVLFVLIYYWPHVGFGANPRDANGFDLLWIVALAGALGSMVHALRSFYTYVGHGKLAWRWLAMYVLLPFVGATLALVFYLVIRGGFFAPGTPAEAASPYGFAALAALVGLFSEQAILKLKDVAARLFKEPERGSDHFEGPESEGESTPLGAVRPGDAAKEKRAAGDSGKTPEPGGDSVTDKSAPPDGDEKRNED
ncbi:MAG: hypothetical protein JSU73_14085 [candidate division WOR-3 bacterium]|nr:MAG: hypothetical protein JSU73_14085 [candidate division WOR-3 bacterium]